MYKFLRFMYETAVSYAATLALLMAVSPAHAATFNLFSPATGILKGMTSTYVTTSASYSDIVALFSGTCNSTTALRGDGSCGTLSTGTVTSVALTAPSVFSVSGSPVTSSGTLAISFATGQTQNQVLASPNGSSGAITLRSLVNADLANSAITINGTSTSLGGTRTLALASSDFANNGTTTTVLHGNAAGNPSFAAVSLTADVSGTLAAGSGGTGVATLTGIAKGNGTSAFTAAASSDVYGLWSGTCSSSTYLRGDGSCQTPPTGGTAANPTATIGLTAVNGSAGTYLRSDGAPALSQAIAPTWTGQHTFGGTYTQFGISAAGYIRSDTANTFVFQSGTGGYVFRNNSNSANLATIADAGNVTINAPSSGTGLTVSGASASDPGLNIAAGTLAIAGAEGSAGQVLTSNGGSAAPSWTTPSTALVMKGAKIALDGSACTLTNNSGMTNTGQSCGSVGVATIPFAAAFTTTPQCSATPVAYSRIASIGSISTTSITVGVTNLSGTNVNDLIFVLCVGT